MTSGRPSAALNPEQCAAIWKNAVPSGDLLAQSAAAPFIVNFTQVDKDGSGDISKSEFEDACAKGLVRKSKTSWLSGSVGFRRSVYPSTQFVTKWSVPTSRIIG